MKLPLKIALGATVLTLASQAMAQITLYENDGWRGRAFTTSKPVRDFSRVGFNDRASSVVIERGQWEVCDDAQFGGHCMVLRRGSYASLSGMGMNDRISSVRPVDRRKRYDNEAPPPMPEATYEYRRRPNESVYQAPVTSVHAVVGPPEQRCWVERQQVNEPARNNNNNNNNVGGVIAGALIGGVLGHQIGGGTGRDVATAGGAIAGATIGSNVGNSAGGGSAVRDVRRCENTTSSTPAYWDVSYNYRGVEHQVQMSSAPGPTIAVNRNGEPRQ